MNVSDSGARAAQLLAESDRWCADPELRKLVGQLAFGPGQPVEPDLGIHRNDQMLRHSLNHHDDAAVAASQYYNVALQQFHAARSVIELLQPGRWTEAPCVLDFACGYGRLLRFMRHVLPPGKLYGAEIQGEALDFVNTHFGVTALRSPPDPAAFDAGLRFDLIWVASLFSHLPPGLFERWLRRLLESLNDDGVLCFSTHGEGLLPEGVRIPASGVLYHTTSENPDLDSSIYGSTFVTPAYVASAVEAEGEGAFEFFHIPRALAHEQDLYVVARRSGPGLAALQNFRYGAWGWVDERELGADGRLRLRGWAASLDEGALPAVDIRIDGQLHHCPTGGERADVAGFFRDPRLARSGWLFEHVLPVARSAVRVEVTASSGRAETALLYAGDLRCSAPAPEATPAAAAPRPRTWGARLWRLFGR